ncbi:restriction endonuclease subunit S [Hippea jasoniae]|uniref:restriction endonuclease subunit S n=1 Tax=Hippea jasoniae TaxID=944479 RepID=UPI000550499E|nr:restriction endonuclease subunit S [Hippea jasoniae]
MSKTKAKAENKERFEEIKNVPYPLPEGWKWVRLGEIIKFGMGKTPKRSEKKYWENGKYYWVSISDMQNKYIKTTKEKVSQRAFDEIFRGKLIPKGTLLMSFKLTIGRTAILDIPAFHNEAIIHIFLEENIYRDYLYWILPTLDYSKYLNTAIKGKTLNKEILKNLLIPLPFKNNQPDLEKQKQIVEKIETIFKEIDKAITIRQKALEKTKELFESVLNKIFKEAEEDKDNWKWLKLGEIAKKIKAGGTPSTKIKEYWASNGFVDYKNTYPWLDINKNDFENMFISSYRKIITREGFENSNTWLVPPNSLLITIGGSLGLVGINKISITTNQNILAVVLKDKIYVKYVAFYLKFKYPLWLKNMEGYKNLSKREEIKRLIPIPIKNNQPDLEKQKQIAAYLDNLHNKIKQLEELQQIQLEKFKQLKESILNKAFRGELV